MRISCFGYKSGELQNRGKDPDQGKYNDKQATQLSLTTPAKINKAHENKQSPILFVGKPLGELNEVCGKDKYKIYEKSGLLESVVLIV